MTALWPHVLIHSVFSPPISFIASDPIEDEDGDFKGKEDREHRLVAEAEKLRVTWNTERRCYLELAAVKGYVPGEKTKRAFD